MVKIIFYYLNIVMCSFVNSFALIHINSDSRFSLSSMNILGQYNFILLWLLSRDRLLPDFFIITTVGGGRKKSSDFITVLLNFPFSSASMTPINLELKIEYRLWHERCCTFHYLSGTDSIEPSLQFSFL